MAKFTKLNIGDSVASSGGRVWKKLSVESAEEESIVGTWVFNNEIVAPQNMIDIIKSSTKYSGIAAAKFVFPSGTEHNISLGVASDSGYYWGVVVWPSKVVNYAVGSGLTGIKISELAGATFEIYDVFDNDGVEYTVDGLLWLKDNATKIA